MENPHEFDTLGLDIENVSMEGCDHLLSLALHRFNFRPVSCVPIAKDFTLVNLFRYEFYANIKSVASCV